MPYYDTLGRYINPFYLDVHPDVRAELEMRAALVASDFRSANTKSIEWPYQKMPWAHIVSVDFPNIKLGFEKEKFDDRNSDEDGHLLLYGRERNEPKIPLLTGVEISNMGQRGSLLKGKFTFTYFPNLTINGFDLEELQGAFFTPGREVQISFGWSVYAENPWVNKLEFKGLIYGFNWSVQPNLSIVADVEVVSATTLALGLSGDQSVLESEQTDIVKVEGWDTELKGLNLLTVIDKDLSVITKEIGIGRYDYVPIEDTTEKLFDYYGIGLPTSEFEEVQNIVVNDYNYDPYNWDGGGTPYSEDGQGQPNEPAEQDPDYDIWKMVKDETKQWFDKQWNSVGGREFTDPNSSWNQAKTWQQRWEAIKRLANTDIGKGVLENSPQLGNPIRPLNSGIPEKYEYTTIDFGKLPADGRSTKSITREYRIIATSEHLDVIQDVGEKEFDTKFPTGESFNKSDGFTVTMFDDNGVSMNNTKKKIDGIGTDRTSNKVKYPTDYTIKKNKNVGNTDKIKITFKPNRNGKHSARLAIRVIRYERSKTNPLDNPNTGTIVYSAVPVAILTRVIDLVGQGTAVGTTSDGIQNVVDLNMDGDAAEHGFFFADISADGRTVKTIGNKFKSGTRYEVGKTYGIRLIKYFGVNNDDGFYSQFENIRVDRNDEFKKISTKLSDKIYGTDRQKAQDMIFTFVPKSDGNKTFYIRADEYMYKKGESERVDFNGNPSNSYIPRFIRIDVVVGKDAPLREGDGDINKEDAPKGKGYEEAKKEFDETVEQKSKEISSGGETTPDTTNPSDTSETTSEEPVSATNESEVKVTTIPKTFWYVRLGALVEFANKLLERFETDPKNKNFARMLFRIQAYNNEAEYNEYVRSAYPIDVFFPDKKMGAYGASDGKMGQLAEFCPFAADGPAPQGDQLLRTFGRGKDKNGKNKYVMEDDVINIGQILVGTEIIRTTYESFLEEGGKNIALKNITRFFDEILKLISTATGEIYQFTAILFEEPEKLIPRSEYRSAEENTKLRGGSRIEMVDIFNYNATQKRSKAIVSLEDTNLASKVIREGVVEPFKFDATVIRPMLRNVQVVSKPSKEMAAAAYIAARGHGAISQGGKGQGIQNLEVTMNLRGFQNIDEYTKELNKTRSQLNQDLAALLKSGWNSSWSELIRGNLIKLKRLTLEPYDKQKGLGTSWLNRAIYPIEFSLTLDGINGFKFGDVIQTSLIPKHYNEQWGIVFTVIKINHKVTLSSWETTIQTAARLSATGNYAAKVETPYR